MQRPTRIKLAVDDDGAGSTFTGVPVTGGTLQGHPSATGVMAVGAVFWNDTPVCGKTPAVLETFSAKGGDPILFDSSGNPLNPPAGVMRQKPDIAGPDGGSDTFLGFALGAGGSGSCSNSASFPNFFGTSAATPHVAATAALLLQQFPGINPSALYTALKTGAADDRQRYRHDGARLVNYTGGYGFIQAQNAAGGASHGSRCHAQPQPDDGQRRRFGKTQLDGDQRHHLQRPRVPGAERRPCPAR